VYNPNEKPILNSLEEGPVYQGLEKEEGREGIG
jgi:hypothetical protein